jgi:hypothetical protein
LYQRGSVALPAFFTGSLCFRFVRMGMVLE